MTNHAPIHSLLELLADDLLACQEQDADCHTMAERALAIIRAHRTPDRGLIEDLTALSNTNHGVLPTGEAIAIIRRHEAITLQSNGDNLTIKEPKLANKPSEISVVDNVIAFIDAAANDYAHYKRCYPDKYFMLCQSEIDEWLKQLRAGILSTREPVSVREVASKADKTCQSLAWEDIVKAVLEDVGVPYVN